MQIKEFDSGIRYPNTYASALVVEEIIMITNRVSSTIGFGWDRFVVSVILLAGPGDESFRLIG